MPLTKVSYSLITGAPANPLDFGALGDGTGSTPNDTGVDISNAPWNTWDGRPFKTDPVNSPYYTGAVFTPPRVKPFANDDTWDYIGISLALWSGSKSVYIPAGTYKINMYSTSPKGTYPGLLIMAGQQQSIYGAGIYSTSITTKENAAFFAAATHSNNLFQILALYKVSDIASSINDMRFAGPDSYTVASENLTLIYGYAINGITFENLWIAVSDIGMYLTNGSNDFSIKGCTAEYNFSYTVYIDNTSEGSIDFCNLQATSVVPTQVGIYSGNRVAVTNTRLIGFNGYALQANGGIFANNSVLSMAGTGSVYATGNFAFTGNEFTGTVNATLLKVVSNCTITGNKFLQAANHPCIALGSGTANSATNTVIVGNTFIKTNAAAEAQNYAIIAEESAVSFVTAATPSVVITNNTFQGRAFPIINNATMNNNTFDGVLNGVQSVTSSITALANAGTVVVSTKVPFTYGIAQVTIGGIVNTVGGVGGFYLCRYNNTVSTVVAIAGMTVTCNDAAGTITLTNSTGNTFDGSIQVLWSVR
jgi:hypothetical protein